MCYVYHRTLFLLMEIYVQGRETKKNGGDAQPNIRRYQNLRTESKETKICVHRTESCPENSKRKHGRKSDYMLYRKSSNEYSFMCACTDKKDVKTGYIEGQICNEITKQIARRCYSA